MITWFCDRCKVEVKKDTRCPYCGKTKREAKLNSVENYEDALDAAHTAMTHALTLGYCGAGSTKRLITDAVKKIEALKPDVSGGIYEEEPSCAHPRLQTYRLASPAIGFGGQCPDCGMKYS